jgi:sulfonate transport system permease protein
MRSLPHSRPMSGLAHLTSRFPLWAPFPILLLIMWQSAVAYEWWPRTLIAAPSDVFTDFARLTASGELLAHARVSLVRLLAGFFFGAAAAVVLGTFVGLSKVAERALAPTIRAILPIPVTAWIPLIIIIFGIEESSKIALIGIGVFGVIYFSTVQGIRGADQKLVEVAAVFEKPHSDLSLHVLLPSALPSIITGMRVALGLAWILLIAAEMVGAKMVSSSSRLGGLGLGWLIYDARNFGRSDDMIVGMLTIGILGKLTDMTLERIERRVLRWRQAFTGV